MYIFSEFSFLLLYVLQISVVPLLLIFSVALKNVDVLIHKIGASLFFSVL